MQHRAALGPFNYQLAKGLFSHAPDFRLAERQLAALNTASQLLSAFPFKGAA